jgi:hypothetical protein
MENLGAIGGPLLAIALVAIVGTRDAMLVSVIPALLATLAILYAIRSTPRATEQERKPLRIRIRPVMHGQLGRLPFGISAFEVGNVAATLLILRATQLLTPTHGHNTAVKLLTPTHGHNTAVKLALGLYTAYNLAATLANIPGGRLNCRGCSSCRASGVSRRR